MSSSTPDPNLIARYFGVSTDFFKQPYHNPENNELLSSLEHDDNEGVEARLFSYCLQEVTESVGPYKIFGSREVNAVGSCVNRFVDAVVKAHRGIDI